MSARLTPSLAISVTFSTDQRVRLVEGYAGCVPVCPVAAGRRYWASLLGGITRSEAWAVRPIATSAGRGEMRALTRPIGHGRVRAAAERQGGPPGISLPGPGRPEGGRGAAHAERVVQAAVSGGQRNTFDEALREFDREGLFVGASCSRRLTGRRCGTAGRAASRCGRSRLDRRGRRLVPVGRLGTGNMSHLGRIEFVVGAIGMP